AAAAQGSKHCGVGEAAFRRARAASGHREPRRKRHAAHPLQRSRSARRGAAQARTARMNRPPGDRSRGSSGDARSAAEKAFKQLTTKPLDAPVAKPVVPHAKEQVTLRLDRDVIEHFQGGGPGWQDRLNDVLRRAIGKEGQHKRKRAGPARAGPLYFGLCVRSKAIVDAGADDIGLERDVERRAATVTGAIAGGLAQIGVEIFDLGRPRTADGEFENRAQSPANPGRRTDGASSRRKLLIAERGAAGDVGQEAIEGVADAATSSAEPAVLGLAEPAGTSGKAAAALDVRPVQISLETPHPSAGLEVVANRATHQRAVDVEVAGAAAGRQRPS